MREFEEMPPAFSAAMRRVDPLLAREDDNPIFAALRRQNGRRWGTRWKGSFLQMLGIAMLCPITIWLGWLEVPGFGELLVAALLVMVAAMMMAGGFLLGRWPGLAALGAGTARLDDRRRARAQDLWMAGATGRMIIEAMYLEGALRRPAAASVAGLAMAGAPVLFGTMLTVLAPVWLGRDSWMATTPAGYGLTAVGLLVFLWRGWLGISVMMAWLQVALLEVQVDFWRTPPRRGRRLRMATQAWMAAVPYTLACIPFLLPLSVELMYFLLAQGRGASLTLPILPMGQVLLPLWLCLLSSLLAFGSTQRLCAARWANLMASADEAFEQFFRETLMGDTPLPDELPPAFRPEEMRRDPMLQAAERNGLFEALRRRAEWHQHDSQKRAQRRVTAWCALGLCVFVYLYGKTAPGWMLAPTVVAIAAAAMVLAVASLVWNPTPLGTIAFPSMGGVGPRGRGWVREFWLVGARGRDVAEAEYLALARRFRGAETAQAALVASIPLAVTVGLELQLDTVMLWAMTSLAMVWLARPGLLQLQRGLRLGVIQRRVAEWRRTEPTAATLLAECLPFAMVCICLAGVPSYMIARSDPWEGGYYMKRLQLDGAAWINGTLLTVAVAVALRGLAGVWQRRNDQLWGTIAAQADAAFPGYFARVAMEDAGE